MSEPDLESGTAELVQQLQCLYGLPQASAELIVSDAEFAAMAKSIIEGRIAREAALLRMDEAMRRLNDALAQSAGWR